MEWSLEKIMSLKDTIRKQIADATKNKQDIQKNVLKVILGEIDTQESRANPNLGFIRETPLADEEICRIVKKTLQGVEEMLQYKPDDPKFLTEKATLQALLPPEMSMYDLKVSLTAKAEEIRAAKSDGQATGIASKKIKSMLMVALLRKL